MTCQGCKKNVPNMLITNNGYPYGYLQNYPDQMNSYQQNNYSFHQGSYTPAVSSNYGYNNYANGFQPQSQHQHYGYRY